MVDALSIITSIAIFLLVGVLVSMLANRLKLPDVLLLILAGMLFGSVLYQGKPLIQFPELFLTSIALLSLALIVFDSAVRIKIRELDAFSLRALKLTGVFLMLNIVVFSVIAKFVLGISVGLSILLTVLISGSSADIMLSMLQGARYRAMNILKLESIFNTPITVLLPFVVLDMMRPTQVEIVSEFLDLILPFLTKFVAGIGSGIFVGIILFKIMQRKYSELYSPLAVVIAALLAYVLAENLGGDGVLSVITLGLFFGNVQIKQKFELLSVEGILTKALYVFVFILVGLVIKLPFTTDFFLISLLLFAIYLAIRYLAVSLCFRKQTYTLKERLFATFTTAKGIATAAVVLTLAIYNVPGSIYYAPNIKIVLDITLAFMLYSIILSTIINKYADYFLAKV